jgi:hypothetical protein
LTTVVWEQPRVRAICRAAPQATRAPAILGISLGFFK